MDDAEFWDWVFNRHRPEGEEYDDYDPSHEAIGGTMEPCPVCGGITACGYDQEGRPMIHAVSSDEGECTCVPGMIGWPNACPVHDPGRTPRG